MKKLLAVLLATMLLGVGALGLAGCGPKTYGTFYTLQEAYDNGYLTREDLMSIAYYHHNGREYNEKTMPEDYAPIPKEPPELGEEISWKIREAAAKELQQAETGAVPEAEAEGMSVEKYYGTYNGSVAVIIGQSYYSYPAVEINSWDTIGGVVIHYWSYDRIQIWLEN